MSSQSVDRRPIGVFDSGVGGLTVVREIIRTLPGEDIVYLGDTARVPYGVKSRDTVTGYAFQNTKFLLTKGVKVIVVACNTACAFSLNKLQDHFSIPCLGVIEPGAQAAIEHTQTARVGIIGTPGTISSQAYPNAIKDANPRVEVFSQACPLFVPLVEEGFIEHSITYQVAEIYLKPLKQKRVDTLILGCTHYPLLKKVISEIMGPTVTIVDSATSLAARLQTVLYQQGMFNQEEKRADYRFFVTDMPEQFQSIGRLFLPQTSFPIEHVDLYNYKPEGRE